MIVTMRYWGNERVDASIRLITHGNDKPRTPLVSLDEETEIQVL